MESITPARISMSSPTIQIVIAELRRRFLQVVLIALLMLANTGLGLVSPLLLKALFDRAIPARDLPLIAWLLVGMVVAPLLAQAISALREHRSAMLGEDVSLALRTSVYDRLTQARILDAEKCKSGEIVFRLTRLCGQIGGLYVAQELLPLISAVMVLVGTFAVMFAVDWRLALSLLAALPLSYLVTRRLARPAKGADGALITVTERGQSYLQEALAGLRTIRAFNGGEYERRRWRDWNEQHRRATERSMWFHISSFLTLGSSLVNNVFIGFCFGFGALQIAAGRMTIGALVSIVAYVPRIYAAFDAALRAQVGYQRIRPAVEKLDELYALPAEQAAGAKLPALPTGARVEFQDVSFHYDRGFGIEHLSFVVAPGEFVGIVGASGGGKSTIVDLLLGFHEPDGGCIAVDGVNLRHLSLQSLREQIGYVSQEVFLWNEPIGANLAYPERGYPADKLAEASRQAEILDFIQGLPDGFGTITGEHGRALSVGERQRLALARAVLRAPRLIVLDEATASLDAITEARVRQALDNLRVGRTMIVVAHRLATVMHADRILVIDQGRLIETGSPAELLRQRGTFFNLCQAQALAVAEETRGNA